MKLVHAFISCHINYCNSLLYMLPDTQLNRIQRIQNSAVRLVTGAKAHGHISPILIRLHWLPVKARIEFKILVLVYKCLHIMAPVYLSELIAIYKPSRNLLSSQNPLLVVPKISTKTYGSRSFQAASADLWNTLPREIKLSDTLAKFMTKLKTFLFHWYFS